MCIRDRDRSPIDPRLRLAEAARRVPTGHENANERRGLRYAAICGEAGAELGWLEELQAAGRSERCDSLGQYRSIADWTSS